MTKIVGIFIFRILALMACFYLLKDIFDGSKAATIFIALCMFHYGMEK